VEAASASGPDDGRSAEGLIVSEPRSSFQFGRCMSASSRSPFAMARQSIGMKVVANPHVGDERDYGPGGEVERLVLDFLADRDAWIFLTDIAMDLALDRRRLDTVLWRLWRAGKLQLQTVGGYVKWRGR
jgi:hypothetical protein